jgi:hypothetical protein
VGPEPVKQGFILGFIVGYRPQDLKDILRLFTSWRNKQNSSAATIELEGPVKVHGPVLWLIDRSWDLILPPFSHEVN